jgi:hypothetical protein
MAVNGIDARWLAVAAVGVDRQRGPMDLPSVVSGVANAGSICGG